MFFKNRVWLRLMSFGFLALTLSACTNFLDGSKKKEEVIELKDDQFSCVNEVPETLKAIGNGVAKTEKIQSSFNCLKEALIFFNKRTKGTYPQGYATEDLRHFFGKYFFKENNISEELSSSLMKLKHALLGGAENQITKAELARFIELWDMVKNELVDLNPHLGVLLFMAESPQVTANDIERALLQLKKSTETLLQAIELPHSNYAIVDFEKLVEGLYQFVHPKDKEASFVNVRKHLPLARALKSALFGEPADLNQETDWQQCIESIIQVYRVGLTWHYNKIDLDVSKKENLDFLTAFGDQLIKVVDTSFLMRTRSEIPFESIDNVLVEFNNLGWLKGSVKLTTWIATYKGFTERVFEGRHDSRGISAFNRAHLETLKQEFIIFKTQQNWINEIFAKKGINQSLSDVDFQNVILGEKYKNALYADYSQITLRSEVMKGHNDFLHLLQKDKPVKFTPAGEMLIVYDQKTRPWTWVSVTRSNLMHSTARLFVLGYGVLGAGDLSQLGVSEEAMYQWYQDFNPLGIELKAFDPRLPNSGKRTFKEANFFTFSGNGDKFLSFDEVFEFLSNLFSAGIGNTNHLMSIMKANGCNLPEMDVFENPYLDEKCFETILRQQYSVIFPNLEFQNQFVKHLNDKAWKQFYTAAMKAARTNQKLAGIKVETGDLRTLVVLLHYIETLFIYYDANKNGVLDLDEIRTASNRFHDFIAPFVPNVPLAKDYLIREGFVSLVATGSLNLLGLKWDELWNTTPQVTQINLLNTIVYLKDKL